MFSIQQVLRTLFFVVIAIIGFRADAALNYQQDLTISSWQSKENLEEMVQEFCNATMGDADIKVIGVKYKQKKENRGQICYSAIITCHVSQKDRDFMRIQGKIFQQKYLVDQTNQEN